MTRPTTVDAAKQPNASQGLFAPPAHRKSQARTLIAVSPRSRQAVTASRGVLIDWLINYCSVDVRKF